MKKSGTLLDTQERRMAAYDRIAQESGTVADCQIIHEMDGVSEGIKRYRKSLQTTGLADTAAGRKIFKDVMKDLVPAIADAQDIAVEGISNSGKGVRPVWWWYISFISPEKLALITIRAMMSKNKKNGYLGRPATNIFVSIGLAVRQQLEFETWLQNSKREAKETGGRDVAARLLARSKNFNQRQWMNWSRKIEGIITLEWPREVRTHVGAKLVELVIESTGGFFEMRYVQGGGKTQRQIFLSDACEAMIEDLNSRVEAVAPVQKPMIAPPLPWVWSEKDNNYVGGYHMLSNPFIAGGLHSHTAALHDPISQATLDAADSLGRVGYSVDQEVLSVAREVYDAGLDIVAYLPKPNPQKLPEHKTTQEWSSMSRTERASWKYSLTKIHDKNARDVSKRESAIRKFHIAYNHKDLEIFHPVKAATLSYGLYSAGTSINQMTLAIEGIDYKLE